MARAGAGVLGGIAGAAAGGALAGPLGAGVGSAGGSQMGEYLFDAGEEMVLDWQEESRRRQEATRRAIERREADLRGRYGR
jgi:hypothetical protein